MKKRSSYYGWKMWNLPVAALTVMLLVSGCGDDDDNGAGGTAGTPAAEPTDSPAGDGQTGTLQREDAVALAGVLPSLVFRPTSEIVADPAETARNIEVAFEESIEPMIPEGACTPDEVPEEGSVTDTDTDGIPQQQAFTYNPENCGITDEGGTEMSLNGTIQVSDKDDTVATSGFRFATTGFAVLTTPPAEGGEEEEDTGGTSENSLTFDVNTELGDPLDSGNYPFSYEYGIEAGEGVDADLSSVRIDGNFVYEPLVGSVPFEEGEIRGGGTLGYSANGSTDSVQLAMDAVRFTADGCSGQPGFESGRVRIRDEENNVLVLSYDSCNAMAQYNGEPLENGSEDTPAARLRRTATLITGAR